MPAPTVAEMLKFANLQMAAEALYGFNAKKTPNQDPGSLISDTGHFNRALTTDIFTDGNEHASRFAKTEADKFVTQWTVVDHISNTKTGFSGMLFKRNQRGQRHLVSRNADYAPPPSCASRRLPAAYRSARH